MKKAFKVLGVVGTWLLWGVIGLMVTFLILVGPEQVIAVALIVHVLCTHGIIKVSEERDLDD